MSDGANFHPAYFATRFRVSAPVPEWPYAFVIVTAFATTGEQWTDSQNARANALLLERIESLGVWSYPVTGFDPGTGHAEPGWAVEVPRSLGMELGREFRQDAIFVVENGMLSVHRCATGAHAALGPFSLRLQA